MDESASVSPFDAETQALLPDYLARIPNPVQINIWGDANGSPGERETVRLANYLSAEFEQIETAVSPRRINYPYYPVIGVFGVDKGEPVDFGIRLIGRPAGLQMTSLIAALQAASFRGSTLEAKSRIQLADLKSDVSLELITSAEDEFGSQMSRPLFGLAVASTHVRAFLIMGDVFPEIMWRYSVTHVPHLVINGRVHIDGEIAEEAILQQIALAVKQTP